MPCFWRSINGALSLSKVTLFSRRLDEAEGLEVPISSPQAPWPLVGPMGIV